MIDRSTILTERSLPESAGIDMMSTRDAVELLNAQNRVAVEAVAAQSDAIAAGVDLIAGQLARGGRLFYFGAGTSGRLGVLDASEIPPTFRADPSMVQGVIAGGPDAVFRAQEGAEDDRDAAARDVDQRDLGATDVLVGIAAGGTTPYVHAALQRAAQRGAKTIFVSCAQPVPGEPNVDVVIRPLTGPEVITGSTRMKAGTATKLVLNALSTLAMVKLGKVYGNLMVDLRASNTKLVDRAVRIVCTLTALPRPAAAELLDRAGGHVKTALVMHARGVDAAEAARLLDAAQGRLRPLLESASTGPH